MHELSICGSIAEIVTRRANGRPVDTIHVRVGQLRQVVPDTLVYCWTVVSADTALDGSRLELENIKARIKCRTCDGLSDLGDYPIMLCGTCDSADVEVVAGEEFLITALELAEV
ncbi:MAG: hydrogenase expression protein HupH [Pseudonocardiales bacterium]|nr:MAG: hydrogenase expression protein HupH [Pseudonocardiales bacterium]